jgi:hypothetical protein
VATPETVLGDYGDLRRNASEEEAAVGCYHRLKPVQNRDAQSDSFKANSAPRKTLGGGQSEAAADSGPFFGITVIVNVNNGQQSHCP